MSKEQSIDLDRKQLKLLEKIIDRYVPNKAVWVYGSRVTWKASQTSDLDLVAFDCAPMQILDLKDALEESDLLISVDVMDWERIPDNFKENIKKKYVVLQEKSELKNWQMVKIRDVANIVGGGTPSTKKPEYWGGEIPWLTPRDLSNFYGRYISKGERNISKLGLSKSSSKLVSKGAVLLTTRAPVGYLAIAENEVSTNQGFRSLIPNKKTNNLFLFYLLKHNVEYLKSQSSGTTFGELAGSTLKSLSFLFPPLPAQKTIAEVLSSLDDKIDLLHRQNKTLEDMAQTLFRQWFVEETDEEWEEVRLGDFFPVRTGKRNANYSTEDGQYPFFTCAQGILQAPNYSFEGKAILLAGNGDFNVKRYVGKFEAYQRTYVLIPHEDKYFGFLYTLIKFYLGKITSGAQGSVINFITKGMITNFTFSLPLQNFDEKLEKINQMYQNIDSNKVKIYTLENLRDTLLPKLMNGDTRIKEGNKL